MSNDKRGQLRAKQDRIIELATKHDLAGCCALGLCGIERAKAVRQQDRKRKRLRADCRAWPNCDCILRGNAKKDCNRGQELVAAG
jgi:hypothetical protein